MLKILIEDSEGKSKIAPINPETDITIGRKEGNSIRLKERNVSRQHARIYSTPDGLFVEPIAARYGLKVNSSKIDGPTPLALGDEIRIGDYRLYLQDESQQPVEQADPDAVVDIDPQFQPRLIVTSSNFAGVEYHITKTRIIIGRAAQCDIHLQNQSVSGQHAEIKRTPRGDFQIRDLDSSNGTKVNTAVITEPVYLNSGDMVTLGHVIMRFCAPGDLWSLNYGMNEEKSKMPLVFFLFLSVFAVILIGFSLYLVSKLNSVQQQQQQQVIQPITVVSENQSQNINDFSSALADCQSAIDNGEFAIARLSCEKASKIKPNDLLVEKMNKKLQENIDSNDHLEEVIKSLSEGRCDDAHDSLESIIKGTWAHTRADEENYEKKIQKCTCTRLMKNALAAVENDEFNTAESLRESIRQINPSAPEIAKIDEAIQAKKPQRPSRPEGSRHKAAENEPVVEAPPPAPVEDVGAICREAVMAKVKGNNCKAYKLYKKALKNENIDAKCKRNATKHIKAFESQCK